MMRHRLTTIFVLVALECGLFTLGGARPARAVAAVDTARITNIGVGITGGTVSYAMCVTAPSAPVAGAVTVAGPKGNLQAPFVYGNQLCAPGVYFLQATFTALPAGTYRFKAACALLGQDAAGNASPAIPCLVRDVGLVSNFQGYTVANTCQVDFDPRRALPLRGCAGPGVNGNLTATTPAPAAATPTATSHTTPTPRPARADGRWFGPVTDRAFFAEGYTAAGYQEYLSLLNPQTTPARARLTIYRADGATYTTALRLGPLSRRTLDVNALAPRASTALRVEADSGIVVERALYTGRGGHVVAGVSLPHSRWYVPEGYVGRGFADGLRIFNPSDLAAALTITAYNDDGTTRVTHLAVRGGTRLNVALDALAPRGPSALVIDGSEPVVVEDVVRAQGASGPAAAMALAAPSRQWYFPDGGTAGRDREYLALFNPNAAPATVRVRPVTSDGFEREVTVRVGPRRRAVFAVHDHLRRSTLAVILSADRPVAAQEVRYGSRGSVALVNGATAPVRAWGFADGYAGLTFDEWITLLNPGERTATATVRLMGRSGVARVATIRVGPHHRGYLHVSGLMPKGPVAAVITSDRPVVAGRTMSFNGGSGLSTTTGVTLQGRS